ncbi:serine hydrolase, partial [Agrobacterium radiobacter]|uniref:serine hydrolase n=1 Tax=Agrobacterium radiobacter TaxID=362 RepID=UPI003CE485FE
PSPSPVGWCTDHQRLLGTVFTTARPHMMHSVTKSFTSMAVGLAVSDGLLSVDDAVLQFFPDYAGPAVDSLRVMKAAASADDDQRSRTWGFPVGLGGECFQAGVDDFLRQPSSPQSWRRVRLRQRRKLHAVLAIVQQVTGRMIRRLPLRADIPADGHVRQQVHPWDTGTDGVYAGGNGLSCTSEDMLKLGIFAFAGWRMAGPTASVAPMGSGGNRHADPQRGARVCSNR